MNLNTRAAARLLCVPEERIYAWVAEGVLPSYRVQEELRFNRVALLEWATARGMRAAPELFEDEHPRGAKGFRLSVALEAGGIRRDLQADDVPGALRALVAVLP